MLPSLFLHLLLWTHSISDTLNKEHVLPDGVGGDGNIHEFRQPGSSSQLPDVPNILCLCVIVEQKFNELKQQYLFWYLQMKEVAEYWGLS